MINNIQRLGVSYRFEKEIEATLERMFEAYDDLNDKDVMENNDLCAVSLRFRLLRQQGYFVSSSVFEKFTESDGKFKESLIGNVEAMLSLYEASNVRVHGEKILDEALRFTTSHLESMLPSMAPTLRSHVSKALKLPIWRRLTRIDAVEYVQFYQLDESHDTILLKFAKLDFNILQKQHQKELGNLTRWWKELGAIEKMPFARDRLAESYLWTLGVYFEPQYGAAREFVLKTICLASLLDDIYDVYGTPNELNLFTHAFQRLKAGGAEELLPEYMKVLYNAVLDTYAEMEKGMMNVAKGGEGESYRVDYAKREMKKLVGAYHEEAEWFHAGERPTFDEYMKVALRTCAYVMLATTSLVGMPEDFITKEAFDWLTGDPLIARACTVICRLRDDIVGHKFEQERGHVDSAVECYMKQYGKTEEETVKELKEKVNDAWKDISKECLKPFSLFPMPILIRVVNLARVIEMLYDEDGDKYTHSSELKAIITSVLVHPIL
ncbi:unnamed protein product [Cuscuta campestris]|uniref:Uncharacterized protein n=1 Tax=Cuscuta campestris TaxID=132261 RepID=A0A484MWX6_9ASTE|nr:unnamed protein product [Cuscuta campestris]